VVQKMSKSARTIFVEQLIQINEYIVHCQQQKVDQISLNSVRLDFISLHISLYSEGFLNALWQFFRPSILEFITF